MNKAIIYHNPRCTKSSLTLQLLKDHNHVPDVIFYHDTPPSIKDLQNILNKLDGVAHNIVRPSETAYTTHGLTEKSADEDILNAIAKNPELLERPIVIIGDKAAIGRPPKNILAILS
jgi:arsenate reductase